MTREISPEMAVNRIITEFSRRGWRHCNAVAADLVRIVIAAGGVPDARSIAMAVPLPRLTADGIDRGTMQAALERALEDVRVRGAYGEERQ